MGAYPNGIYLPGWLRVLGELFAWWRRLRLSLATGLRNTGHTAFASAALLVLPFLCALFAGAPASAECDANALCPGNPCTITGAHVLDPGCDLDFVDTVQNSKDVTIDGAAVLSVAPGTGFSIEAHNLTVRGVLRAKSASTTTFPGGTVFPRFLSMGTFKPSMRGPVLRGSSM